MPLPLTRRRFVALGAAGPLLFAPRMAFASAATDRRFVFIIQRGAADGLATVIPQGDPALMGLRGELTPDLARCHRLDGFFALHPALPHVAQLYGQGQALFVHAVASPYRDRSHFDGQNVLETGGTRPYARQDGWLNRLLALMPGTPPGLALAPTVPLALRGAHAVESAAPTGMPLPPDDLIARLTTLYAHDAGLAPLWAAAREAMPLDPGKVRQDAATFGQMAATFLARASGPRIAMLETGGWDTHSGQAGRLTDRLRALDSLIAALQAGLGADVWAQTTVLVATEFGRTAAANGTGGTDHGTGAVAMLLGGAVKGGRVIADWPGLATAQLLDGRDLRPTLGLDSLITQAAAETFGLDPARVSRTLFDDPAFSGPALESPARNLLSGLVAA